MAEPFRVLIVGGGVAALEAALALHELADERVATTLLAPEEEFVYRPWRVREPFSQGPAGHYRLGEIARDIGAKLIPDSFRWLDSGGRTVHTKAGEELCYDALLMALGARQRPRFTHALTLDDRHLDEQIHALIQDVESGYARKLAFLVPSQPGWPLPLYELALMTARRAKEMNQSISLTLLTPEDAPLAVFGSEVSQAVELLLEQNGILTISSMHCETPGPGEVALHPGRRSLSVDRVVALPELVGPAVPGVPRRSRSGFIPVDVHGRVPGLRHVFAAGDATDFAVKHGGIAAQQADVAAEAIAALAGAPVSPSKFHPMIRAILLGGDHPLYMSAHITGGHGSSSRISDQPLWSPPTKIAARYLSPYLEAFDPAAVA
jgi:sulfide:quinone oxidoreductase